MLSALMSSPFGTILSAASASGDRCGHETEGQCRHHCPPRRTATRSCHETGAAPSSAMTGRCGHQEATVLVSIPEFLPTRVVEPSALGDCMPLASVRAGRSKAGHQRIDPRPPRIPA